MIRSDKKFLVLYGEAEEATGRIWGLENGGLMFGQQRATVSRISIRQIYPNFKFLPISLYLKEPIIKFLFDSRENTIQGLSGLFRSPVVICHFKSPLRL
jgi:hypothetical protein